LLPGVPSPGNTRISSSYVFPSPYSPLAPHPQQAENVLTVPEITFVRNAHKSHLESGLSKIDSYAPQVSMLEGQMAWPASVEAVLDLETGVGRERLVKVGRASVDVLERFASVILGCVRHGFGLIGVGDT
jgi:hypothetical protein